VTREALAGIGIACMLFALAILAVATTLDWGMP
jgi:hypothetical protein